MQCYHHFVCGHLLNISFQNYWFLYVTVAASTLLGMFYFSRDSTHESITEGGHWFWGRYDLRSVFRFSLSASRSRLCKGQSRSFTPRMDFFMDLTRGWHRYVETVKGLSPNLTVTLPFITENILTRHSKGKAQIYLRTLTTAPKVPPVRHDSMAVSQRAQYQDPFYSRHFDLAEAGKAQVELLTLTMALFH